MPYSTYEFSLHKIFDIFKSFSATILFSIFIAVNVANTYPYLTSSPSLKYIFVIVPGIGAIISP